MFSASPETRSGPVVHFTAGVLADVAGSVFWTPMDVVKQRLQVQRTYSAVRYRHSLHAVASILRAEGLSGLYVVSLRSASGSHALQGYLPALATFGPFVGIYFLCYEAFKDATNRLLDRRLGTEVPFAAQLGNLSDSALC
jgi:hypothetical protein